MWMHKRGHHDERGQGRPGGPGGLGGPGGGRGPHGGHRPPWAGGGEGGDGPPWGGGRGGRARRGAARWVLLDALKDGPKHGYEIIKALEERSGGQYAPSPGTVYPTLQYLEDQGLVRAEQQAERRVYQLTDQGRTELETRAPEIAGFWNRFASGERSEASQIEIGFLRQEIEDLVRTVRGGLHGPTRRDDPETVRSIRRALTRCKEEIRQILAGGDMA